MLRAGLTIVHVFIQCSHKKVAIIQDGRRHNYLSIYSLGGPFSIISFRINGCNLLPYVRLAKKVTDRELNSFRA